MKTEDKTTIGVRVTPSEFYAIETHTQKHGITKTELLRAFIRTLPEYDPNRGLDDLNL